MENYECFDLADSNQSRKLYRYISRKRLYDLFKKRKNVLVIPSKWDDPYEGLVAKYIDKCRNNSHKQNSTRYSAFAQCWTTENRSDAMWRIYCGGSVEDSVRIRTSLKKIEQSIKSSMMINGYCCIGKVKYLSDSELKRSTLEISDGMPSSRGIAKILLLKRRAFRHEKEARLIHIAVDESLEGKGLFSYQINPHDLIDQVMLNPRISQPCAASLKKEIINETGFKGEIKYSLLYTLPNNVSG
jgi:hypothetical protein